MDTRSLEELESQLETYKQQHSQVRLLLASDPHNEDIKKLLNDVNEAIQVIQDLINIKKLAGTSAGATPKSKAPEKEYKVGEYVHALWNNVPYVAVITDIKAGDPTLGDETKYTVQFIGYGNFAELTADKLKPYTHPPLEKLQQGAKVLAVYSADGLFYEAVIDKTTEDNTAWVTFNGYGNIEEVPFQHIRIIDDKADEKRKKIIEKQKKPKVRKSEIERIEKQQKWQTFLQKKEKKPIKAFRSGVGAKESIFKSPDSVTGKVGVVGSGKGVSMQASFVPLAKKRLGSSQVNNDDDDM